MTGEIRKLLFTLDHPIYVYKYYMSKKGSFEDMLNFHSGETLKILSGEFHGTKSEALSPPNLIKKLMKYRFIGMGYPAVLYVACRLLRPKNVIETGVGAGLSSAFILQALEDNKAGLLYSIDAPRSVYNLENGEKIDDSGWIRQKEPGWLVPAQLKSRWKLNIGESSNMLAHILKECGSVDIFFHDSEHTYRNMMFEYEAAYPYLKVNGVLLSHDIDFNNAFHDFANNLGVVPIVINKDLGLLIKEP